MNQEIQDIFSRKAFGTSSFAVAVSQLITDENREAAPRPRHCGVLCTRTHTRASSLMLRCPGIPNPCGYSDQPALARLGRMVTAGRSRPAEQPLRLSHNTKSQAPEPSSQSHAAAELPPPVQAAECRRRSRPRSAAAGPGSGVPPPVPAAGAAVGPPSSRAAAGARACGIQSNLIKP